jgi:transposase
MGRSYAPEFRHRVVQRVRSGRSVKTVAAEVGASEATVFRWVAQDRIDRRERPGHTSKERSELAAARRRIRQLENELAIIKEASAFYSALDKIRPKGSTR